MPPTLYGIMRREHGYTRGWHARFQHRGRKADRFFADRKYGGSDAALERAREFRDQTLRSMPGKVIYLRTLPCN